jgi:hypothetical protein
MVNYLVVLTDSDGLAFEHEEEFSSDEEAHEYWDSVKDTFNERGLFYFWFEALGY